MKKLINKPNVDGVSATYPYGNMRDRGAGIQGSEMNTEFHTDYVQFFEKMFAESGLTANGLPDNVTNGFQLFEAARISIKGYKSYVALVSQAGTGAPTATVIVNELGGTVSWTRAGTGVYSAALSGAFVNNKTFPLISSNGEFMSLAARFDSNSVAIQTYNFNTAVYSDNKLNNTPIEIRVYY